MKKLLKSFFISAAFLFNLVYLFMIYDCYRQEYQKDGFVHWGFPQWGWLYQSPEFYHHFTICYMVFLVLALGCAVYFLCRKKLRLMSIMLGLPLISAFYFAYLPTYNWNKQFKIFNKEKITENSRVPAGEWWVSEKNVQGFADASKWERFKGFFARGEWPGGYAIWGEYRIWLVPDVMTDTLGRRGLVVHGGTKNSSPWGIDMGDDIVDFVTKLRQSEEPIVLDVTYDVAQETSDDKEVVTEGEVVAEEPMQGVEAQEIVEEKKVVEEEPKEEVEAQEPMQGVEAQEIVEEKELTEEVETQEVVEEKELSAEEPTEEVEAQEIVEEKELTAEELTQEEMMENIEVEKLHHSEQVI